MQRKTCVGPIQPDQVRELANIASYRDLMKFRVNPNKFPPSVEAMVKRILKGGQLPTINALVDYAMQFP